MKYTTKSSWAFTPLGSYPYHCLMVYNMSHDKLCKELTRKGWSNWAEAIKDDEERFSSANFLQTRHYAMARYVDGDAYYLVVLNGQFKLDDLHFGIVAHECFHITQFLFEEICADIIEEKEAAAYFHTFLMSKVVEFLRKCGVK